MKVAVINFSGNVGKSTVARHLLAPRMNNAEIIAIESINSDGTDEEAIRGKQFGELMDQLALLDDVVIDVGASNVEDFITRMKQYHGSHEDFDYFVVPTVPAKKQQRDTVSTIKELADLGVPSNKIRLIMNMVEVEDAPDVVFSGLFQYAEDGDFTLNPKAVIRVNDLYGKLKGGERSIAAIVADQTDLKAKLKEATEPEEKLKYSRLIGVKRLAQGVTSELDEVFTALFK